MTKKTQTPKRCLERWPGNTGCRCELDRYHGGKHEAPHPILMATVRWGVVSEIRTDIIPDIRVAP